MNARGTSASVDAHAHTTPRGLTVFGGASTRVELRVNRARGDGRIPVDAKRRKLRDKPDAASSAKKSKRKQSTPASEGQRRFQALTRDESYEQIGARLGASKQIVAEWFQGRKRPGDVCAKRIELIYGIAADAWRATPSEITQPQPQPQRPQCATATRTLPSVLDDCLDVLAGIREQRQRSDLLNSERVKLADTEARILSLRARLELDAETKEDRFVRRHPAWPKLRDSVVRALKPYPEAMAAVVAALGANQP